MIDRLRENPLLAEAARVGVVFGRFPDEVLDCPRRIYLMRVAGAQVVHRDRQTSTPTD